MENSPNFKGKDMKAFYKKFHIAKTFSFIYYLQGNGLSEATNKIIKIILTKIQDKYKKDWYEKLRYILWAYRTHIYTITGETPFSLVYGNEAIVPLELDIPSLRISLQGDISNEEARKVRLQQLESLDEKRIKAIEHQKLYHEKIKRAFGKRIKAKEFKVEDLVLKENINKIIANDETKGKFKSNWSVPYIMIDAIGSGAYRISSMDGKEEPKTLNDIHIKHFYAQK